MVSREFQEFRRRGTEKPYDFPFPEIAGRYEGKQLVICGDAACLWDDLERFECRCDEGRGSVGRYGWHIMTVNKVVDYLQANIEHAYCNEGEWLERYVRARRPDLEFDPPRNLHARDEPAQWRWPWNRGGTAAFNACLTAVALGYSEIVLAGIPLDERPHVYDPPWRGHISNMAMVGDERYGEINPLWRDAMETVFNGRVKSLSGRTREWLGEP